MVECVGVCFEMIVCNKIWLCDWVVDVVVYSLVLGDLLLLWSGVLVVFFYFVDYVLVFVYLCFSEYVFFVGVGVFVIVEIDVDWCVFEFEVFVKEVF